ncbi:hypothetical protein, partial [Mesorhizobium sp.]|uniref:hypothetical protein n=1 Tax=Mesorhizobium sp. TaxID=1871066 RepID=UPI0025BF11A5
MLDSVVKERWVEPFVSTEARILQRPVHLSSDYFQKLSKISSTTSTTCASDLSLAGGEFYSVTRCCQHLFFTAFDREDRIAHRAKTTPLYRLLRRFDELKRQAYRNLVNSLKLKEFSVSTAPEVGRIIDIQNLPSTLYS